MYFCIKAEELRKALKEIEEAERSGFMHCLSVFRVTFAGERLDEALAEYSDLWVKAHPTDGKLNWGRHQDVTQRYRFKNGKLTEIFEVEKGG